MDVAEAIDAEAYSVLWKTRTTGGYNAGGTALPRNTSAGTAIQACIQPVSGRQLMELPEGVREAVTVILWTRANVSNNDLIVDDGTSPMSMGAMTYQIKHVWMRRGDGFTRAAAGKQ